MLRFPKVTRLPPRNLRFDRVAIILLVLAAAFLSGRGWLADNPEHDPLAPLDLRLSRGWATAAKLAALQNDVTECRAVLERSEIAFTALPPTGEGACRRDDRLMLDDGPLTPGGAQMTCPVAAALAMWAEHDLQPLAEAELGSQIERIEHVGTYSCRQIGGGNAGNWSEHATGNAVDIAAFVLADGRRVSVLNDWGHNKNPGEIAQPIQDGSADGGPQPATRTAAAKARFLDRARDTACTNFGTVLSPDYNAAHADHLHLDQARSPMFSYCR